MHNDPNTFTASDQHERELIWNALQDARDTGIHDEDSMAKLDEMIKRVSRTFSWMRD